MKNLAKTAGHCRSTTPRRYLLGSVCWPEGIGISGLPDLDDAFCTGASQAVGGCGTSGLGKAGKVGGPWEYEIRVSGLVPESVLVELEGMSAAVEPVHTVLCGPVVDQSALRAIIDRLQRLGLDLIEVHRAADHPAAIAPPADPA